jgi:hypothetical protein
MSLQIENSMNYSVLQGFIFELSKLTEGYNTLSSKIESLLNNTSSKPEKLYYNTKEVMDTCGITSTNTLKEWRIQGILKGKKVGGIWLYKAEEVLKLID